MKKTLFCLLFLLLLITPVFAEGGLDVSDVEEALPEEAREISGVLVTDGSYDMHGALARLAERAKKELTDRAREELREIFELTGFSDFMEMKKKD